MDRLTTPVQEFLFEPGVDPSDWVQFRITYAQNGSIVLEKSEKDLDDMTIEPPDQDGRIKLWYRLSQKDTRKLYPHGETKIQIRCMYADGTIRASEMIVTKVLDVLNQEIFVNES